MTSADLASSLFDEVADRITSSIRDVRELCRKRGCELTDEQEFILTTLPLQALLGFSECAETMVSTYDAIKKVLPDLPEFPGEVVPEAWLRDVPTERFH